MELAGVVNGTGSASDRFRQSCALNRGTVSIHSRARVEEGVIDPPTSAHCGTTLSSVWFRSDRFIERLARCVIGLAVFGVGVALLIHAELGAAPWDVLHDGLSELTGLSVGVLIILTGVATLGLWVPLRERPGLGTVINAVMIGLIVQGVLPLLPDDQPLAARTGVMFLGIMLIAVGSSTYIGAGLGAGPRDGLMTGLARQGISIRTARTLIEVAVVAAGLVLGGSAGVGTIAFAVGIGPLVHVLLRHLTMRPRPDATEPHATVAA
jgi:uncharacterized membrane protein YczE